MKVTKEEYVLDKALKVLKESTFPDVKVGYIGDMSVLALRADNGVYYRNININSISASVRELSAVTDGTFKEKWQFISLEDEVFVLFLEEISHLIDEDAFDYGYEISITEK